MLDEVNPYVHQFRSARERFNTNPDETLHMRIVSNREKDGRTYDTPTASEVAALIPGDFSLDMDKRDIVLEEKQTGWLKGSVKYIHLIWHFNTLLFLQTVKMDSDLVLKKEQLLRPQAIRGRLSV